MGANIKKNLRTITDGKGKPDLFFGEIILLHYTFDGFILDSKDYVLGNNSFKLKRP